MKQTHLTLLGVAALLIAPVYLQAADAPPATETKAEGTSKPAKPAYCQTAGRIRVRADSEKGCANVSKPYRSYSKDQIDTTGKIDVAEALETIDPIFHPN